MDEPEFAKGFEKRGVVDDPPGRPPLPEALEKRARAAAASAPAEATPRPTPPAPTK